MTFEYKIIPLEATLMPWSWSRHSHTNQYSLQLAVEIPLPCSRSGCCFRRGLGRGRGGARRSRSTTYQSKGCSAAPSQGQHKGLNGLNGEFKSNTVNSQFLLFLEYYDTSYFEKYLNKKAYLPHHYLLSRKRTTLRIFLYDSFE